MLYGLDITAAVILSMYHRNGSNVMEDMTDNHGTGACIGDC